MKTAFNVITGTIPTLSAKLTEFLRDNKDKNFKFASMCSHHPQYCMFIFWDEEEKAEDRSNKNDRE